MNFDELEIIIKNTKKFIKKSILRYFTKLILQLRVFNIRTKTYEEVGEMSKM